MAFMNSVYMVEAEPPPFDLGNRVADREAVFFVSGNHKPYNPRVISGDAKEYRRLLELRDVDAVVVATPMQLHAAIAVDSLRAGKHTLSEVAAATTLRECWGLVNASEETGRIYMLAENACYQRNVSTVATMVKHGIFGDLTFAECGYVHELWDRNFKEDGTLDWRGELVAKPGNWYPTHSVGPVAQWLGINRGDRFVSLVSTQSLYAGMRAYVDRRFGKDSSAARTHFAGDTNLSLIHTDRGRVIEIRLDVLSNRPIPTTTYYGLQGTKASYKDHEAEAKIWVEGRSKQRVWRALADYQEEFEHPLWKKWGSLATPTEHEGSDFFSFIEFIRCVRTGAKPPIDVYDAATWSAVYPLSAPRPVVAERRKSSQTSHAANGVHARPESMLIV